MRRRLQHGCAYVVCATASMYGFCAAAEDQFRMLDGKQIRTHVVGQDITNGPHWSMYVRPDGALIGEESGSSWTGRWKIQNDRLCITLPSSTSAECNEVWMSGTLVRMRASKDQETFDAIVMAHRAKKQ